MSRPVRMFAFILALLLCVSSAVFGQSLQAVADLENKLESSDRPGRAETLLELGRELVRYRPRTALAQALEAQEIAESLGNRKLAADALVLQSHAHYFCRRHDALEARLLEAMDIYSETSDRDGRIEAIAALITHYSTTSQLDLARRYRSQALGEYSEVDNPRFHLALSALSFYEEDEEAWRQHLETALALARTDLEKAFIYADMADVLDTRTRALDSALDCAEKALEIFEGTDNRTQIKLCEFNRLDILRALDPPEGIIASFEELESYFRANDHEYLLATVLEKLGYEHRHNSEFDKALECLHEAEGIFHAMENFERQSAVLYAIGGVYYLLEDYENVITYAQLGRDIAERANSAYMRAFFGHMWAEALKNSGQLAAAREMYLANEILIKKLSANELLLSTYIGLADLETKNGRHRESLIQLRKALAVAQKTHVPPRDELQLHARIASASARIGDREAALFEMQRLESLAADIGDGLSQRTVLQAKVEVHEALGEFEGALAFFRELVALKERQQSEESRSRIDDLKIQYDTLAKEREIELLKERERVKELELKKQTAVSAAILVGVVLMSFLAIAILVAYRVKTNALEREEMLARIDPLTRLWNRRAMNELLQSEVERFQRNRVRFSLVLSDIDFFKGFNDEHGHACGDKVLEMVAGILSGLIRRQDRAARWGGEEFLLLLPETDVHGAVQLGEKIRGAVAASTLDHDSRSLRVTMSFGVCEIGPDIGIEECLKRADQALYVAKDRGRNRVQAWVPEGTEFRSVDSVR